MFTVEMVLAECILEYVRWFIVWEVCVYNSENYKYWEASSKNPNCYLFFQSKYKRSVEDNFHSIQNTFAIEIIKKKKEHDKRECYKNNNNNKNPTKFLHSTTQDYAASYLQLYMGTNIQISSELSSTIQRNEC